MVRLQPPNLSSYHSLDLPKVLLLFLLTFCVLMVCASSAEGELKITLLHTNDVHSRFLQTNKYSGSCSAEDELKKNCFGGFARLHHKVREIRASHRNVLYLSGGDYYQGTVWYTIYKWRIVSHFVNRLNHTAMAFGNHEFDDNVAGLVPFIEAATFPLISCNIDDHLEPTMTGKYKKSYVATMDGGRKVGIIGYTTPETMEISNPGSLLFEDVTTAVSREAARLYAEGVNILIAVGHAGYDIDMKVAEDPLIDAVVGGHTNTFLYHGKAPHIEEPLGDYPTIVTKNGRKVPVVQAYAFGKYLGYLNITFDDQGEVTAWSGNPILLDHKIPEDPVMLADIQEWGKNLSTLTKMEVGKTRVFLDGRAEYCRLRECNLGNVIADAMVFMNIKFADDVYWSDVTMAFMNSGGIRSSIDEVAKNGSVNMEDVLTILPFQNTIDLVEISGKHLIETFEFAVDGYDPKGYHLAGKFLQVSGLRVTYDICKPKGSRVKRLLVLCKKCRVPIYEPINETEIYKAAVPTYIATGGDGYNVIKDNAIEHHLSGILDSDMIVEYFRERSPIIQGLEGRIIFENSCSGASSISSYTSLSTSISFIATILTIHFHM